MAINLDTFTGPSFTLGNRVARVTWWLVCATVFRWSPRPMHGFRAWILGGFGATIGKGVHVYPGARIWAPWNLELGDECGIADGAILYSQGKIVIGPRAVISQGAHICTGTHDFTLPGSPLVTREVRIGAKAWVAAEAFVHPGVNIGTGAVIGARAVVTKDMPDWTVCAGHPCVPIKPRVIVDLMGGAAD